MMRMMTKAPRRGYRPSIRLGRHGHPMRDEQGHDSGQPGDNPGVTGAESQTPAGTQDNAGDKFDFSKFWQGSEGGESGSPSGDSADSGKSPSGQQEQQPKSPSETLVANLQALDFGDRIMTDAVIQELAEGKTENFHKNLNIMGRQISESTIRLMIPLMGQMRDQMRAEFQQGVQGNNVSRDNETALLKAIPSAADAKIRPTVDRIFEQAMKHSKGNRDSALAMTKDMLRIQMEALGTDLGIPPKASGDNFGSPGKVDWLAELAGR